MQMWGFHGSYFFLQLQLEAKALAIQIPTGAGSGEQRENSELDSSHCNDQGDQSWKCHWIPDSPPTVWISEATWVYPIIHPFICPLSTHPPIYYHLCIHQSPILYPSNTHQFYLFMFRGRGREGEREGEKQQCLVVSPVPHTGDLAC